MVSNTQAVFAKKAYARLLLSSGGKSSEGIESW
jgi:hypothetical protein